jgi:phenylacetate-CoA ligase
MIVNEDIILEIVRPGTDDPVAAGEVGEIVVTRFNPAYPLIRFGTGDLSAVLDEPSPCGRTNMRIKGWMGRADQRTKVKGMFVDPKQVDRVVKAHPEIGRRGSWLPRWRSRCDDAAGDRPDVARLISRRSLPRSRPRPGCPATRTLAEDLPNDGKVIDDTRDYEN